MKAFNCIFMFIIAIFAVVVIFTNMSFLNESNDNSREYRVQIERVCSELKNTDNVDISKYSAVTDIIKYDNTEKFFEGENSDYVIRKVNDTYYRIEYVSGFNNIDNRTIVTVNISFAFIFLVLAWSFIFIKVKILIPFQTLINVPEELAKGNLTVPIKQEKNRYFGKFVWGLDLLREKLEDDKKTELKLLKEKKTLIMSISHDIKTPLSAIKLYAKALSQNLYKEKEKQTEAAENINKNAVKIEAFVSEIIETSNEEFMKFNVNNGEFYLSELVHEISKHYKDKLSLLKIDFEICNYDNCVLKGDLDRSVEVLQNLIENAAKYGDGHIIKIDFSEEEDCRLVCVTNGGCTLSENEIPHMFESFWRGANSHKVEGSGLGLYICRQLMHLMDGEIFSEIKDSDMTVTLVFRRV